MPKHELHTNALQIADALGHQPTDRRLDILRRVGEVGSISQAARGAGVSYKAAWQAIDTLSNLAGLPLVEKLVGGAGGGGARLTDAGRNLLSAAQKIQQARTQVLQVLQAQPGGTNPSDGAPPLWALSLRTSMRNQLPCTVAALQNQTGAIRVDLRLADDTLLCSRLTRESVELLGLRPGLAVLALCKATAVDVAASAEPRVGLNLLPGRVSRATRSKLGGEVALALDSGLQLVGFCAPGAALKPGSRALASVDHASVVLALPQ